MAPRNPNKKPTKPPEDKTGKPNQYCPTRFANETLSHAMQNLCANLEALNTQAPNSETLDPRYPKPRNHAPNIPDPLNPQARIP